MEVLVLAFVMLLGFGAYWAMVLFPKQRDFTKRQRFVRTLAVGDEVVTYGGIIGKIVDIEAEKGIAYVEIAQGMVVRLIAAALIQPYDPEEIARAAQKAGEDKTSLTAEN